MLLIRRLLFEPITPVVPYAATVNCPQNCSYLVTLGHATVAIDVPAEAAVPTSVFLVVIYCLCTCHNFFICVRLSSTTMRSPLLTCGLVRCLLATLPPGLGVQNREKDTAQTTIIHDFPSFSIFLYYVISQDVLFHFTLVFSKTRIF